ncbi:uncharacterized protein LOC117330625 isoform X2 [Pecten maximus]|uniref:uncharacterized protein LOC117330625 isoform X2 n=1 Tax=Pecten maximus TaxID=6579 RepID=UPI001458EC8B|nr:uncharacterized protein LOC117330625 isoform X2 [Pecten maximus]
MVSRTPCIYIVLIFICWLTMEISANTTCYISGNETRVTFSTYRNNNCGLCKGIGICVRNIQNEKVVLSGHIGTLFYEFPKGNNTSLTLILANITSPEDYKQIHLLTCNDGKKGKLRFGQSIGDSTFTEVFHRFENYNVTQKCSCFACRCENGNSCSGNSTVQDTIDFFCNCKFSEESKNSAVERTFTTTTVSNPSSTTTLLTTVVLPQITTKTFTSMTTQPNTTSQSDILLTTSPSDRSTSPQKDYVSADHQSQGDGIHTMAIVGGLVALVVLISSVILFICLRRRKWNKKPPDSAESCITNPAYGEAQDDKKYAGLDNNGYEETENDVHTYAMAEDPKHEPKDDVDYNYANFGGQPKFQGLTPTLNPEKTEKHAPRPGFQAEKGNAYFLSEAGLPQNDDYDLAKDVTGFDAHGQLAVNSNSLPPLQDNYFVVKKSGQNSARTENSEAKLFVHERHDNDANERTATEAKNAGNDVYELVHSRSHQNDVGDRKGHGKRAIKPHQDVDTYDHVRVGHAQTNGIDDGVYDELRKQNVRYRPDDVDNDYDHC